MAMAATERMDRLTPAERKKWHQAKKRVHELEKELARKDAALAETAALLVLKKKAQTLWGEREDV